MDTKIGELKGSEIHNVGVNYESIVVYTKDGSSHRIEPDELVKILKKHTFTISKKRTRTYISKTKK